MKNLDCFMWTFFAYTTCFWMFSLADDFFSLEKIGFTVLSHKGLRASGHLYRNVWKLGDLIRQRGPLWLFTLPSISRQVKPKGSWTSFFVLRLSGFSSRFVGMENVAHALQDQNWFWISFILTFWEKDRQAIKRCFFENSNPTISLPSKIAGIRK